MAGFVAPLILLAIIATGFIPARLIPAQIAGRQRWLLLAAGRLDTAERAAKFFDLSFVGELLALGDLDELKHFVELVNHLLERLGNFGGVRDGFADGRGFGGAKIGGLGPLTLRRRFRPAVARRFGSARWLRRVGSFRGGFGLVRGKFGRRFRVRFAKIAGGIGLVFGVFGVLRCFGGRRDGINRFRCGRNFFGASYAGLGNYGTRTTAPAAPATAPAIIPGGTTRRGRIQVGLFVWHKIVW